MARNKKNPKPKSLLSTASDIATQEVLRLQLKSKEQALSLGDAKLLEIYCRLIISKRESQLKLAKDQLSKVSAMSDEELRELLRKEITK